MPCGNCNCIPAIGFVAGQRGLDAAFMRALKAGILQPLLNLIHVDRDLNAEIRSNELHVYCKGNVVTQIFPVANDSFKFTTSFREFWPEQGQVYKNADEVDDFCNKVAPLIKHRIARQRPRGNEIEYEQLLIRTMNNERINSDYISIDRQVSHDNRTGQMDVHVIFWPNHGAQAAVFPAIIEVKYRHSGDVTKALGQILAYYKWLTDSQERFDKFVGELQVLLRQKICLGLISRLDPPALSNLKVGEISREIDKLQPVIALIDYPPNAGAIALAPLNNAPDGFKKSLKVYRIGLGMWQENAQPFPS